MQIATWRFYELGDFRILEMPLPTNPYWTTHRIYQGELFVAAMFSKPSLQQCEDRLAERKLGSRPGSVWRGYTATQRARRRWQRLEKAYAA